MKDGRFEKGDLVVIDNKIRYFVNYYGKSKTGEQDWLELCVFCPVNPKTLKPDLRILNSRGLQFDYRANVATVKLYDGQGL